MKPSKYLETLAEGYRGSHILDQDIYNKIESLLLAVETDLPSQEWISNIKGASIELMWHK